VILYRARPESIMSRLRWLFPEVLVILILFMAQTGTPADFSQLRGAYLGQKPPGENPEAFAGSMFSGNRECGGFVFSRGGDTSCATLSPDGKYLFFVRLERGLGNYFTHERYDALIPKLRVGNVVSSWVPVFTVILEGVPDSLRISSCSTRTKP